MSKKPRTRLAIILDKSGSMAGTKTQVIEGLNEQIQQAKQRSKDQDVRCCLVTFDGEVYEHLWDEPAEKLIEASPADFVPNGSTAWRDAVGYTVQKLLNTADADDKDTAYLVYVISDGQTNADQHYGPQPHQCEALKELIEGTQATGRWTYTYMGHNANYIMEMARATGVPIANVAAWSNKTGGDVKRATSNMRQRMNKFYDERAGGKLQSASFNAEAGAAMCADYTDASVPEPLEAAAPDMAEVKIGKATDLNELMGRLPKYTNVQMSARVQVGDGVGLFSNTTGVKWEDKFGGGEEQPAVGMAVNFGNMRGAVNMVARPAVVTSAVPVAQPAPVVRTKRGGAAGKPRTRKKK